MPTLKTEILGLQIKINFEENERDKLLHLINNFKMRLNEFTNDDARISKNTIMFLAALKAEDQIEELKNILDKKEEVKNKVLEQKSLIEKLSKEIVLLKDQINEVNKINSLEYDSNSNAIEEIVKLENILKNIQQKILSKNDDRY